MDVNSPRATVAGIRRATGPSLRAASMSPAVAPRTITRPTIGIQTGSTAPADATSATSTAARGVGVIYRGTGTRESAVTIASLGR